MKIKYEVSNEASPKKITDSASFKLLDRADEQIQTKNILSKFKIKTESGESFNLTISVTDENKKTQYTQNVLINRKNYLSRQNFLITADNKVSYKNSFLPNQNVNIQLNSLSRASATVDCFFKEFAIALPPFSNKINEEFKYKPDSSFTISLTTSNLSDKSLSAFGSNAYSNPAMTVASEVDPSAPKTFIAYNCAFGATPS